MYRTILLITGILFLATVQAAQLPPHAAIASAHPMATKAGFEMLEAGGNAFDAAIAISATLAVVEPYSAGLGGGGFWLLHREQDNKQIMIDGRERAPWKARFDMYQDKNGNVIPGLSIDGPLAAGIPGVPAALVHMAKNYGRLGLKNNLAPAIRIARKGFKVTPKYRRMAKFRLKALRASPAAAKVFLHNNDVPPSGHVIKQPDLVATLQLLAEQGKRGFYKGEMAYKLSTGTKKAGGIWSMKDLRTYEIKERKPIRGEYKGYKIISAAPPSSGGVAIMSILNMLSGYDLEKLNSVKRKHLIVEAMRRAYRDRAEFLGDPDFGRLPLQRLLSMDYAATLRKSIKLDKATPSSELKLVTTKQGGRHTTHFSILDKQGNRVAATLSINYPFGSGFMPPGTGVLLNDEMDDFSAKPGAPNLYGLIGAQANAIAPAKRMLSSMSPTFMEGHDKVAILGTPGGSRIITMVLHSILGIVDGKDAKSIVSEPRYHHQYLPDVIQYEKSAFNADEAAELQFMGHTLKELENTYGNMHVVLWNKKTNKVTAASDLRGEGSAGVRK